MRSPCGKRFRPSAKFVNIVVGFLNVCTQYACGDYFLPKLILWPDAQ